jgi:DNA repair exonuclease SbcCD ATPase subunit
MSELVIKTHDFERSKNQLKVFSEQTPQDLELRRVDISGGFLGRGDHKVTGYELNSLTTQIQEYLIDFNTLHTKFINEFGQVYNALEALDKDYIQAILIAIKAAEKANNDIKTAQSDITKTIEIQKKTISALKQFKEKIDSYKHLIDIDKMWNESQKLQKDIATISDSVTNATVAIKEKTQELKSLQKFKEQIDKIKHLKNVDELWDATANFKKAISSIDIKIDGITESLKCQVQMLESLVGFKKKFESLNHIEDVDKLWDDTLKIHNEIASINSNIENSKEIVIGQQQTMRELCKFKDALEKCEHLRDIDILWCKAENISEKVSADTKRIDEAFSLIQHYEQSIDSLVQFKNRIDEYEHLKDVDETWKRCNTFELNISSAKDVMNAHQKQIEVLQSSIQEIQEKNEERSKLISKKLKAAYILVGSSIGIATIEFVLLMTRIF